MADREPGTDVVSVWLERVAPAIEIINKIGLTTVLILIIALGVGWASGYIPLKPFNDLSAEHAKLSDVMRKAIQVGEEQLDVGREQLTISRRTDRRTRIIDCAKMVDKELRDLCLYVDEEKIKQ